MAESTPRRFVVTGANRGLGLEFTRQWLQRGDEVFALARDPASSEGLRELAGKHPGRLWTALCDVADDRSVEAAASAVREVWDRVDCLLNNAGVGDRHSASVDSLDFGRLRTVFEINTLGPLRLTGALLGLLKRCPRASVVNMTSLMGSIADNGSGGAYGYRMSKAALNMATKNLAHELGKDGIVAVVLHPGWVKTDMGGPRAPLETADAIAAMVRTIDGLGPEHNGAFLDRNGGPLPW
jgi:NAD(P)-dependent dehydrogenase (short-subunit alcohol dehydrogenase family)